MIHSPAILPPLGLLKRYLELNGWIKISGDTVLEVFSLPPKEPGDDPVDIILNRDSDGIGADTRIEQAVRTLSQISGVTFASMAARIRMLDYDIVKAVLPDSAVFRDSIRLRLAERFIAGLRRLLASTAIAQYTGATYVAQGDPRGADFVGNCRLGHTFRGSFGFTIESPVGPNARDIGTNAGPPAPFERRVVERLALGLRAVETSGRTGGVQTLEKQLSTGANVNMLDDLSTLVQQADGVEVRFGFVFSDAWLSSVDQSTQATIRPDTVEIIQDVVRRYRKRDRIPRIKLVGHVYRLEIRGDTADLLNEQTTRDAFIEVVGGEFEGKTFRLRLSSDDYFSAIHAHESGKVVMVEGDFEQTSRGYSLSGVRNFVVL